jgi:hypothetical protein
MVKRKTFIKRSKKPLKRSAINRSAAPIRKKRSTPRRGRVVDLEFLAWLHRQPGVVRGGQTYSVHHIREFGSPKKDRRALPLEFGYHQYDEGEFAIERIGKAKWQEITGVCIEAEITRLNSLYDEVRRRHR